MEAFLLLWAKDLIKIKLKIAMNKKKGAKFVIGLNNDKSIRISAEVPEDNKKFVFRNHHGTEMEIPISAGRLFFAPQFGVQAAIISQGSKIMVDPFADKVLDPIDGDYIDVAIKKAKMIGEMGSGWLQSKEQKMLLLLIVLAGGGLLMQFATMSSINEAVLVIQAMQTNILNVLASAPRVL